MIYRASYFVLMIWPALVLYSGVSAAPAEMPAMPVASSVLPVTVTLDRARFRQAVTETLGTGRAQDVASGVFFDGAVAYMLNWSVDLSQVSADFRMSRKGVLMELSTTMELIPGFTLGKGADKIYSENGCGRADVSLLFSVELTTEKGRLVSTPRPARVTFPQRYRCVYERNILGDVRNIFTRDTKKQVNVVPLLVSGIKAKIGYLTEQLQTAVSGLAGGDSLRERINERIFKPWQVTPNLWLWAKVDSLDISALTTSKGELKFQGEVEAQPRFGFGSASPKPEEVLADAVPTDNRFHIPFDLLIPMDPLAADVAQSIEMGSPRYRFRPVKGAPGVVALQRYQTRLEEDVVLLQGSSGRQIGGNAIPMEGPIGAVLEEIVEWLENNAGVRTAEDSSLARLLSEVRRVGSVVAHFQRPRSIALDSLGSLTLSNLTADLQWVSLELNSIRAGVLLKGTAKLVIAL